MKSKLVRLIFSLLFFVAFLTGCTSGNAVDVEAKFMPTFSVSAETQTSSPTAVLPMVVAGETTDASVAEFPADMAVVLVGRGETLNLRAGAGIENEVIGELAANQTGLMRTGRTALSGDETWLEIRTQAGETGWVNANFLTEYVTPDSFCKDVRIPFLFENLLLALQSESGEMLAGLVSPAHGLDLRYFHTGNLANYTPEEARWVFESSYKMIWGNAAGTGNEVTGTFREIPLPRLLEVFGADYELYCNDIGQLNAFAQQPWRFEYQNINFYRVFVPGSEQYDGLDWRAWLVGVEYVGGEPYLFALINFEWTP